MSPEHGVQGRDLQGGASWAPRVQNRPRRHRKGIKTRRSMFSIMVRPAGDAMVKFVFQSEMTLTLARLSCVLSFAPHFQIELLVQEGGNEHDEGQAHERAHPVKLAEAGNVVAHGLEQRATPSRASPAMRTLADLMSNPAAIRHRANRLQARDMVRSCARLGRTGSAADGPPARQTRRKSPCSSR